MRDLLCITIVQLLDAYEAVGPTSETERRRGIFADKLAAIRRRVGEEHFESLVLDESLIRTTPDHRLEALAHVVLARSWISQKVIDFFSRNVHVDSERWAWSIHRLLRHAATLEPLVNVPKPPQSLKTPSPESFRDLKRFREALPDWQRLTVEWAERILPTECLLPSESLHLQETLSEIQYQRTLGDPQEALLLSAIFGGFGDYDTRRRNEKYLEYAHWLAQPDTFREASLDAEPWRYVPRFGAEDTVYSMAVHLDTSTKKYYKPNYPPSFKRQFFLRHDDFAKRVVNALNAGQTIGSLIEELELVKTELIELAEWLAIARICGFRSNLAESPSLSLHEADRVRWHLHRIRDQVLDACHRGASALQLWVGTMQNDCDSADMRLVHRILGIAFVTSGSHEVSAQKPDTASYTSDIGVAEEWGGAFLGITDDVVYSFAVQLDRAWSAKTAQEHQALMWSICNGANIASLNLNLPDILDFGTGKLPLPPPAFYEAVIALTHRVEDRIRADLAEGWMSVVTKELLLLDPIARACALFYAPKSTEVAFENSDVLRPLEHWRQILSAFFCPRPFRSSDRGHLGIEHIAGVWSDAWDAAADQAHHLILARDALFAGLMQDDKIDNLIRDLLLRLEREWCLEGALLAGSIARSSIGERSVFWLKIAVDCLARTENTERRSDAILAISRLSETIDSPEIDQALLVIKHQLGRRDRAVAEGRPANWVREWAIEHWPKDEALRGGLVATLIVATTSEELERGAKSSRPASDAASLWVELQMHFLTAVSEAPIRRALDKLMDLCLVRPLILSKSCTDFLQAAANQPDLADRCGLTRLLPLLDHPTAAVQPVLRQWRILTNKVSSGGFLENLRLHAALWLGELNRYPSVDSIADLVYLYKVGDDRSRARVRFQLGGREWWLGDRPGLFSLAELKLHGSKEIMEELGKMALADRHLKRSENLGIQSLREWMVDSPDVVSGWFAQLSSGEGEEYLLPAILIPWRWSADCVQLWDMWFPGGCKQGNHAEAAVSLALRYAAATSGYKGIIPQTPAWNTEDVPDISWLPDNADGIVHSALLEAKNSTDVAVVAQRATELVSRNAKTLRDAYREGKEALVPAFQSLGMGVAQTIGELPETAWIQIADGHWSSDMVTSLMYWTRLSLREWDQKRNDSSPALKSTCVSQLCLLACLADAWPNAVRHAALYSTEPTISAHLSSWATLICHVILYSAYDRMVTAAWSVFPLVVGPESPAEGLWAVLQCSMADKPIVRDRAINVISSSSGRSLVASMSESDIRMALRGWAAQTSSQTSLAMARVFAILAQDLSLDPSLRQEIRFHLRALSMDPNSHRVMFRVVGSGDKDSPFSIEGGKFLDEELRVIDSQLFLQVHADL